MKTKNIKSNANLIHSMARTNLNKSEKLVTITTEASKYLHAYILRWVWEGGFQMMQILGLLLGMYFDAAVVFATNFSLLFRLAMAILWYIPWYFSLANSPLWRGKAKAKLF